MQTRNEPRLYNDRNLNQIVSRVLATGLVLALVFMVLGGGLAILHPDQLAPKVTPLGRLFSDLAHGAPMAFLSLGIVILLTTPALRVLVLFWQYFRRREWFFWGITLIVLLVLSVSVFLGLRGA